MTRRFLQHIHIDRYGAIIDRDIGPFEDGLNIVFGPNEAGKTTIASFIGGVLFGWEEARGVRNTYRPSEGERSGSLVFEDAKLSRAANEDGLQGDRRIVADIDSATYRTMFSLTADELRSLRNTPDIAARLITAGSGTGSSPAAAFVEIEQRIAALTASNPPDGDSIMSLTARLEAKRAQMQEAGSALDLCYQEDREMRALMESRAVASGKIDQLNNEIEEAVADHAALVRIDEQIDKANDELAALKKEQATVKGGLIDEGAIDAKLIDLDTNDERNLRDKLDEYADEQARIMRAIDIAKENSSTSAAAFEALSDIGGNNSAAYRKSRNRGAQIVVSILLTLAFIGAGIPIFFHGRDINSLSFTALGIMLVVLAFCLAAATIVVLFRPNREMEALESRKNDAQWVMLQDKKKLEVSQEEKARFEADLQAFLAESGLGAAGTSIRQARSLLDDARDLRGRLAQERQRDAALAMRYEDIESDLQDLNAKRRQIERARQLPAQAPARDLQLEIERKLAQRNALLETYEQMNIRYGELDQRLSIAGKDKAYDAIKLEYHQLQCRLGEAKDSLTSLLLAKRMLERSIAAWESRDQPEVYAQAGNLLSQITGGAWIGVSMSGEGRLVVSDPEGKTREPRHLSLGTCQQLYLALRIALLMNAGNVGASIPVLADDILVNFDSARREGAARALVQLAGKRQVIVFTCHRETVRALSEAADFFNYIEL